MILDLLYICIFIAVIARIVFDCVMLLYNHFRGIE